MVPRGGACELRIREQSARHGCPDVPRWRFIPEDADG